MKAILKWASVALMCAAASPAAAQWTEVRSENVIFKGQSETAKAQTIVQDLEMFRGSVLKALGAKPDAAAMPIRVFTVKPAGNSESLLPFPGFSALSQSDLGGAVFLINDTAAWTSRSAARQRVMQDYAQELITSHAPDQYPHWMQSGLADYLAGADMTDAGFVPGGAIDAYDYALSQRKWVPMKTVLGAKHGFYPVKGKNSDVDTDLFQQAQSWAAMRYVMQNPAMSSRLPEYLNRLDAAEAPHKAFKRAFGLSPKKFEKRLRQSLRQSLSQSQRAEGPTGQTATRSLRPAVSVVRLDTAASSLAYGDVLKTFAYTEAGLDAAKREYAKATLSPAQNALALAGQAEIADREGRLETAQSLMARAAAKAPRHFTVQKRAGIFYMSQFEKTGELEWLEPARRHLLKASKKDPAVNFYYAALCSKVECEDGGAAGQAALTALNYYADAKYIDTNFNVLPILDESGEYDAIRTFAAFAQAWGPSRETQQKSHMILKGTAQKKTKAPE